MAMDAFTKQHLEAWLLRHVSDDERDSAREKIISALAERDWQVGHLSWREILMLAA